MANLLTQRRILAPEWDPYRSFVSLHVGFDEGNGATNFRDFSPNNFAISVAGTVAGSTTQSIFGGASAYFDNSTSNRIFAPSGSAFAFGTGDFTVEAWVYLLDSTTEDFVFDTRSSVSLSGIGFSIEPTGRRLRYSGNANNILTSGTVSLNVWTHVAWTMDSGTLRGFIDGTLSGSATPSLNLTQINGQIGNVPFSSVASNMYVDEVRVTKGIARYVATFSPPQRPYPRGQ